MIKYLSTYGAIIVQGVEHIPTQELRALVSSKKARGCTNEEIAEAIDLSADALTTHYEIELRTGKSVFGDKVFSKMAQLIDEGSERLVMFYCTHQLKWTSGDKEKEVDAQKEMAAQAQATNDKLNQYTDELREAKEP